jgi:hypothetical protein
MTDPTIRAAWEKAAWAECEARAKVNECEDKRCPRREPCPWCAQGAAAAIAAFHEHMAAEAMRGEWLSASAEDVVRAAISLAVASAQLKFDATFDVPPVFSACSRGEGGETLSGNGMVGALGLEPRTR